MAAPRLSVLPWLVTVQNGVDIETGTPAPARTEALAAAKLAGVTLPGVIAAGALTCTCPTRSAELAAGGGGGADQA